MVLKPKKYHPNTDSWGHGDHRMSQKSSKLSIRGPCACPIHGREEKQSKNEKQQSQGIGEKKKDGEKQINK